MEFYSDLASINYKIGSLVNFLKWTVPDLHFKSMVINNIYQGVQQHAIFNEFNIRLIEECVEETIRIANLGHCRRNTVDRTPLRNKYFFGEGYTYGSQMLCQGRGMERLYPHSQIDPVPLWIDELVIKPMVETNIIPKNFINSAVINDYQPGGCIASHIDPQHLFDRPIVSLSLMSDGILSFGCKFLFKPIRVTQPIFSLSLPRGVTTLLSGYAANNITHCIRPQDTVARRTVIVLRRVLPNAPRLASAEPPENLYENSYHLNTSYDKKSDKIYKKYPGKNFVTLKRKNITVRKTFFPDNKKYSIKPFSLDD